MVLLQSRSFLFCLFSRYCFSSLPLLLLPTGRWNKLHGTIFYNRDFMETIKQYYRVDQKEISFLKFIIEAYDNIANITTIDSNTGIIVINIAPGCIEEVRVILSKLMKKIMLEPIQITDKSSP